MEQAPKTHYSVFGILIGYSSRIYQSNVTLWCGILGGGLHIMNNPLIKMIEKICLQTSSRETLKVQRGTCFFRYRYLRNRHESFSVAKNALRLSS